MWSIFTVEVLLLFLRLLNLMTSLAITQTLSKSPNKQGTELLYTTSITTTQQVVN